MDKKELTCIKVLEGEIFEIELPLGKGDMWCIECELPDCLKMLSNRKEIIPEKEDICKCRDYHKDCCDPCCDPCFMPCPQEKKLELKQVFKLAAVKPCCVCLKFKLIKICCKVCEERIYKIIVCPRCEC